MQNRRSILCPNCRKLISVDEPRCPFCGTARPGSWWKNNRWTRDFGQGDDPIRIILYVNVALYIVSVLFNRWEPGGSISPFEFFNPSNQSLLFLGASGTIPIDRFGRWWTLASAGFLHGNLLHIFFNMMAFRQLASLTAQIFGTYRLLIVYLVSGVVGFHVSYLAGVAFTIGASASVCGMIGAVLYYGKSRGGAFGQAIYKQVGMWAAAILVFGLLVPGINNWGHAGGFLAGILLGFILGYEERSRETITHKSIAGLCSLATAAILCWALLSGIYHRFL